MPIDAWLLALEIAKLELRDDLAVSFDDFLDAADFIGEWIVEIRLHSSQNVVF